MASVWTSPEIPVRFGLGLGINVVAGWAVFRESLFDTRSAAFECLTVGALCAGMLALLRSGRTAAAIALATGYALLQLGWAGSQGWFSATAGALLAAGVLLVSLIFDLLARSGIPIGKFLVLGPLLGGIYLAVTPLSEFGRPLGIDLMPTLLRQVFLGVLIGDGVGLGIEMADLLLGGRALVGGRS